MVTSNNYFNFILVACHLCEWIKEDERYPKTFRDNAVRKLNEGNYKLFLDMANRSKHFKLKNYRKTISKDDYIPGFNYVNINYSNFNYGGPIFEVEQDGVMIDLFDECEKIYKLYEQIFI